MLYERNELTREGVLGFLIPGALIFPPPSDSLCFEGAGVVGELPLPLDDGLEPLGGCGNAPTLIVFRNGRVPFRAGEGAFEAAGVLAMLEIELLFFCFCIPTDFGVGRPDDTLRDGVAVGAPSPDAPKECLGVDGVLKEPFLVLETGKAGNGVFGGPSEGRDGRGKVVAMIP